MPSDITRGLPTNWNRKRQDLYPVAAMWTASPWPSVTAKAASFGLSARTDASVKATCNLQYRLCDSRGRYGLGRLALYIVFGWRVAICKAMYKKVVNH